MFFFQPLHPKPVIDQTPQLDLSYGYDQQGQFEEEQMYTGQERVR